MPLLLIGLLLFVAALVVTMVMGLPTLTRVPVAATVAVKPVAGPAERS
jgi:hypothetical protein